ncbi:hypothetical protein Back2_17150 [Nocardioides baekrokdamisoli]|uniref:RHS repeat-associated core domain-containing protein n=1 Tax=Nocardioides baekrokdamisoli TaxID=1804624 RepID=A0A3G9J1B8_9ACTN|nr:hypothetical protein Back2_17150 [Nocardioides baekrokdamisoli]
MVARERDYHHCAWTSPPTGPDRMFCPELSHRADQFLGAGHYDSQHGTTRLINDQTGDYIYGPDNQLLETTTDLVIPSQDGFPGAPTSYALTDAIGSTRAQISPTNTITGHNFSPYGTSTDPGAPQYAQGNTDPLTGYNYLLNRNYDPATGTFTSIDPMVDLTGQPYTYAGNDPTNRIDPTGLCVGCGHGLSPMKGDVTGRCDHGATDQASDSGDLPADPSQQSADDSGQQFGAGLAGGSLGFGGAELASTGVEAATLGVEVGSTAAIVSGAVLVTGGAALIVVAVFVVANWW